MTRKDFVLAALAASDGAVHTPVQVQKLLFLLDEKISQHTEGPHFKFVAHDYGPFNRAVYEELESLERDGLVEIARDPDARWKTYRLTPEGQKRGLDILTRLDGQVSEYIRRLSDWVRSRSFAGLVSAIYREYPDMQANSVFRY